MIGGGSLQAAFEVVSAHQVIGLSPEGRHRTLHVDCRFLNTSKKCELEIYNDIDRVTSLVEDWRELARCQAIPHFELRYPDEGVMGVYCAEMMHSELEYACVIAVEHDAFGEIEKNISSQNNRIIFSISTGHIEYGLLDETLQFPRRDARLPIRGISMTVVYSRNDLAGTECPN
ncbi:MAG: hypothetical protein JO126_02585 [Alphaproteobacteria bacterium]|nr:hypothetical protein [Alphaproteobacteria bacterium]MBV8548327.1 hypothetical protein [Alphaproteobacteria bacterium]